MIIIKKYANGRLYDTVNKTYLKKTDLARLVKKGTKFKVVLTKTGKDVTRAVVAALPQKPRSQKAVRPTADSLKKWLTRKEKGIRKTVSKQVNKARRQLNFPTRDQVIKLTGSLNKLQDRISELEKNQGQKLDTLKKAQAAKVKRMQAAQEARIRELEAQQAQQLEALAAKQKETAAA